MIDFFALKNNGKRSEKKKTKMNNVLESQNLKENFAKLKTKMTHSYYKVMVSSIFQ